MWFEKVRYSRTTSNACDRPLHTLLTVPNLLYLNLYRGVLGHRTSSNFLEPHYYKDSKVCRVLSHEFGVVRLYRTFSIYIVTGKQGMQGAYALVRGGSSTSNLVEPEIERCVHPMSSGWFDCARTFSIHIVTGETSSAGCLCTSSGWFKHIEPYRTFSNDIIREIPRCVEFCHMSSGWFEPYRATRYAGCCALVRGG